MRATSGQFLTEALGNARPIILLTTSKRLSIASKAQYVISICEQAGYFIGKVMEIGGISLLAGEQDTP